MEYSGDQFDVIVIGAGIMGSSTAYQIAKRGHKILLLEQFDFLHHRGSSHGESRTLRATYPEDYYYTMVMESVKLWKQAESEIGYKVYFPTQHFDMGPPSDKSLYSVISNCKNNSIPHQILDHTQVCQHFSGRIKIPEDWIGVCTEVGGVIKPTKAVAMYQTLALQNGAILKDNMEINNITKDDVNGGIVVEAISGEKFRGKKCVVTVGAWTKKLIERFAKIEVPIQPLEVTVYYWRIKHGYELEFTIGENFPTFASYGEPYIYGTPAMEYPGLIKIAVHGGCPCDPDERRWVGGGEGALRSLREWIEGRFGGLVDSGEGPVAAQSCMYSMSPDEDFVMDYLGGEMGKDVVVGGGFSGHGFKMGPAVGRMLAEMAVDGAAEGVEHFGIGRFRENVKGNVKVFEDQVKFSVKFPSE